jgi:hypothetical protein
MELLNNMFKLLEEEKTYLNLLIEREKSKYKKPKTIQEKDQAFENFKSLVLKKGYPEISDALKNLHKWNKKKNPELSVWAKEMQEKIKTWVAAGKPIENQ